MTATDRQNGVILINVLALVAIASMAVLVLVSVQNLGVERSVRFSEAAQADAINRGGIESAIAALRRDAVDAPEIDHEGENWANIEDRNVGIENGTFSLDIEDAQGKLNINTLPRGQQQVLVMQRLFAGLGLEGEVGFRILAYVETAGPLATISQLSNAGLSRQSIDLLSPHMVALPQDTSINLNAASEQLLAALYNNPVTARRLVAIRDRQGFLTARDIEVARLLMPAGTTLTSDYFTVTVQTRMGGTTRRSVALLQRREEDVDIVYHAIKMAAPV